MIGFKSQDLNRRVQYFCRHQSLTSHNISPYCFFEDWQRVKKKKKVIILPVISLSFLFCLLSPFCFNTAHCACTLSEIALQMQIWQMAKKAFPSVLQGEGTVLLVSIQQWRTENSAALGRGEGH